MLSDLCRKYAFCDFGDYYTAGFTVFPNRLFGMLLPTQAATYLHLRQHANKTDGARPSVATVTKGVGKGRRTVQYAIEDLENIGEIKRESRGMNRPCYYHFTEVPDDDGVEKFTKVPNWVLGRRLSPPTLMVYVTLVEVWTVNKTLRVEDLARKARISKTTAENAVQELECLRLIKVRRDRHKIKRNRYSILPRQLSELRSTDTAHQKMLPDMGSTVAAHSGTEIAHRSTETAHHVVPPLRTNKTHQKQHSPKEDCTEGRLDLPLAATSRGVEILSSISPKGDRQELRVGVATVPVADEQAGQRDQLTVRPMVGSGISQAVDPALELDPGPKPLIDSLIDEDVQSEAFTDSEIEEAHNELIAERFYASTHHNLVNRTAEDQLTPDQIRRASLERYAELRRGMATVLSQARPSLPTGHQSAGSHQGAFSRDQGPQVPPPVAPVGSLEARLKSQRERQEQEAPSERVPEGKASQARTVLGLQDRLAQAARDSGLSREALKQHHADALAERLRKHR